MGGDNYYWEGTPLYTLYLRRRHSGGSDVAAEKKASQDAGRLLKRVLCEDCRAFRSKKAHLTTEYHWVQ